MYFVLLRHSLDAKLLNVEDIHHVLSGQADMFSLANDLSVSTMAWDSWFASP